MHTPDETEAQVDVVIIGGGAAGLSAALMLTRARRRVVVVDGGEPRNRVAPHMHGVLGHDGKPPLQLLAEGRAEVESYGGVVVHAQATGAERRGDGFAVTTDDGRRLLARRLVVATGVRDELPAIPGLAEQWGTGVVVCPYCDGYEARDRRIGVIATSALSVHQAQMLRQWSARVTYFVEGQETAQDDLTALRARGILVEEGSVDGVVSDDGLLTGVALADGRHVELDTIFTFPRPIALDAPFWSLDLARQETPFGPFLAVDAMGATSVDGVWAVGNVTSASVNVPAAMGAGSLAGAAVNADLVAEDIAAALAAAEPAVAS